MTGENTPKVKKKAPKEEAPLTQDEYDAQMQQLAERARAAGLNPIRPMASAYVRQGMSAIEGLLTSLENASTPKKRS